ncbi:MAG: DUF512 domain-containing protein [Oscillospiraceae bacterium]|jgi:putative radical SAM enzyme (TIGR03279 family)|nr:DUF512 domain-containing protein [Oscillospiraceae bacterium]
MAVLIDGVENDSPAARKGVRAGDFLLALGGHPIDDVLDYRFYLQDEVVDAALRNADGTHRLVRFRKEEADDIGLSFSSYLMDKQRSCRNKCVFCFIDQLPKGLRKSLYFKDDDARLSFLFGNYITLTNLTEREAERIIEMHISPVNISIHTMNPALRVRMMGNPAAGESLKYLRDFSAAGIRLNLQLVLCPGMNDGGELLFSLRELQKLGGAVQSIAAVPVGLTKHREGLAELHQYTREGARAVLNIIDKFNAALPQPLAFAADEFYLKACVPIPPIEHYGELHQLENGVGMSALFRDEFISARGGSDGAVQATRTACTVATGEAAYPLIRELCGAVAPAAHVIAVPNRLFGSGVTVSGLLCGADIVHALRGQDLGDRLLLPASVLNRDGVTLDDMSVDDLARELGTAVVMVAVDGAALRHELCGG